MKETHNDHAGDQSKLTQPYNPQTTEKRIYSTWKESGLFNPDICIEKGYTKKDAPAFSMVMPPPNVTGVLHMGHALMLTIEDIMVRYKRMQGFKALWIPGTDHAAIATQSRVEKDIYKAEGKNRHQIGREPFLRQVEEFALKSQSTILSQVEAMGASADWSRLAYTLDPKISHAVHTMFKKMYDDGLIYRGHRIVNWDPKGQTTISDDEIVYEPRKAKLYTFKYSHDIPITISSTRPETKVGDTAIAVAPNDARYAQYVGKEFSCDFAGEKITLKVVEDSAVDPAFGTGALGVTPAHSQIDWAIAEKHKLPYKIVINEQAKIVTQSPLLNGKKVAEARETVVEWLKANNLLINEEEVDQNISTAERTGGIIEPLPKLQWFINVNKKFVLPHSELHGIASGSETTLKEIMLAPLKGGQLNIMPDNFNKVYTNWIENLQDWCISRQIWFGYRIPVWYRTVNVGTDDMCAEAEEIYCGEKPPEGSGWSQDEDTLDTWFSSALWTFATLGWPEKTEDLRVYHPTAVLETGYEILFFWVARMVMMSGYALGQIPFSTVYLHGTVRDAQGRKMSKSLGNGIDPLDVADKFGADAGRMALIAGNTPGTDTKISEDKIKGYKHFANKLWNITRLIEMMLADVKQKEGIDIRQALAQNSGKQKMLDNRVQEINTLVADITTDLDAYRFHLATEKVYQYTWHTFADIILEEAKVTMKNGSAEERIATAATMVYILETLMKVLHPFMPFVTEELWAITGHKDLLMVTEWPKVEAQK